MKKFEESKEDWTFRLMPASCDNLVSVNSDNDSFFRSNIWQKLITDFAEYHKHELYTATLSQKGIPQITAQFGTGRTPVLKFLNAKSAACQTFAEEALNVVCTEDCQLNLLADTSLKYLSLYIKNVFKVLALSSMEFNAVTDEFYQQLKLASTELGFSIKIHKQTSCYKIDLSEDTLNSKPYLQILNHKTRRIINKTINSVTGQYGEIQICEAASPEQAIEWFDALTNLNLLKYKTKTVKSSFENPFLKIFNNQLLREQFDKGTVSIKQFKASQQVIGYIYGFQYKSRFYAYQSGFDTDLIETGSIGIVCHLLLIEYYRTKKYLIYDFLAGDYQYKRSLANQTEIRYWLSLRKPSFLYSLEDLIRAIKSRLKTRAALK